MGSTAMQQTVGKVPGLKIISGALVGDNVEDVDSAGAQQLEELRAHSGDPSAGFSDTDTDLEEENFRNPLSAGASCPELKQEPLLGSACVCAELSAC